MSEGTKRIVVSLAAGLLFGLGLVISGMSDPAKVLNFLDIAGQWDPSLAFVMAGAVALTCAALRHMASAPPLAFVFFMKNAPVAGL